MKKLILFISILLLGLTDSIGQGFQWARRLGGYGVDFGNAAVTDASGNVYVTGQFEFDGHFNSNNTPSFSVYGGHDIFLAKYNPQGGLVWVQRAGGTGGDAGTAICLDPAGNIYITGEMESISHFGSIDITSRGNNDAFIAKYDNNGNCQWAVNAGGYSGDRGRGIAVDASGNVYLAGEFRQTANFGSSLTVTAPDPIYKDFFVAKYSPSLGWLWVKRGGSDKDDDANALCLDNNGNVYVTGFYRNNASIEGGSIMTTNGGTYADLFVAKYSAISGNLEWFKRAGGSWDDEGRDIIYNNTDNLLYVTGEYRGTSDFGAINMTEQGYGDMFLACYSPAGTELWVKGAGGSVTDFGRAISLDNQNNIYIAGRYGYSATFNSGTTLSGDTSEVFIASYDKAGGFRWVVDAKGTGNEDNGRGIAVSGVGDVYVIGNYNLRTGTASEELMVGQQPLMGFSNEDGFLAKYSQDLIGVKESEARSIVFYPNPAHETVTIAVKEKGAVSIENSLGQQVFYREFKSNESLQISLSTFSSGMYFVKSGLGSEKLIIK